MSGPKVVRVITKQETMAICRGRIHALRDELNEWRKFAARHDALSRDEEKEIEDRFCSITQLFELEQFKAVQNQCTTEIAFLKQDTHRIREQAIAEAEKKRSLRRSLQYSAETLIRTFEASGRLIPNELKKIATSATTAPENELSSMGSMLNQILTEYTLSIHDNNSMTPLQKELAKHLTEEEKLQTLAEWKIDHDKNCNSKDTDRRLDKLLAEIEVLESKEVSQHFLGRIAIITQDFDLNRRSLLIDSMVLDLVAHSKTQKEKEKSIASMREIRSKLRSFTSKSATDLDALITKAIDSQDISQINIFQEQAISLIDRETKSLAGIARRQAMLKTLTVLGYEVRENMITAWVEKGRIVVRKPDDNAYGVELGAVADAERIQIQLVSFEQQHSTLKASLDLNRETIWCSEFDHLKSLLAKSGTTLEIEKALPIGTKPLKIVDKLSINIQQNKQIKTTTLKQILKDK